MKKVAIVFLLVIFSPIFGQIEDSTAYRNGVNVITRQISKMADHASMAVNIQWQGNKVILKSQDQIREIAFSNQEIQSAKEDQISKDLLNKISIGLAGR